jgi:hypothetical protein
MDDKLWRRLRVFALKNNMSTSEAIRRAVEYAWFDSSAKIPSNDETETADQQEEVSV